MKFTPGGKWKIVTDLKGFPTHEDGGVDIVINGEGVFLTDGEGQYHAKKGLVVGEPKIRGPVSYANAYYNSPQYKKRLELYNAEPGAQSMVDFANMRAQQYDKSKSMGADHSYTDPIVGNVHYSAEEAERVGLDLSMEVVPHEYSHFTRQLTNEEAMKVASLNRNPKAASELKQYVKGAQARGESGYNALYTPHLNAKGFDEHTINPDENVADLSTLRWLLYDHGYYDARKGDLDLPTLQKALKDPQLKDSYIIKRMLQNFSPENIVKLNNEVAYHRAGEEEATAKKGAVISGEDGKPVSGPPNKPATDATRVARTPELRTVQAKVPNDPESQKFYGMLQQLSPPMYDAIQHMGNKYGLPKVVVTEKPKTGVFKNTYGHYDSSGNGIITLNRPHFKAQGETQEDEGINQSELLQNFISEYAHHVQHKNNGELTMDVKWILNDLPAYITKGRLGPYGTPGTMEYQAHTKMEPKIKQHLLNDAYGVKSELTPNIDSYPEEPKKMKKGAVISGGEGTPVYGPGGSLIGTVNKGVFTPAGAAGQNKSDTALVANQEELKKFLSSKGLNVTIGEAPPPPAAEPPKEEAPAPTTTAPPPTITAPPPAPTQPDLNWTLFPLKDTRKVDAASNTPMTDYNRLHSEAPQWLVENIVRGARKHNVDPYTALAIAMQETQFKDDMNDNPMRILWQTEDVDPEVAESIEDASAKFLAEKLAYAKRLGKKTEAEMIQAWNGYGKVGATTEGQQKKMYGIDVTKEPIDMNKNPVYGKRIIDLRENVIKKNPDLVKLVNSLQ